jgi:hypothetical protein
MKALTASLIFKNSDLINLVIHHNKHMIRRFGPYIAALLWLIRKFLGAFKTLEADIQ